MAELQVLIEKIHEIKEHPNADRMEIAVIGGDGGYQCCVQKDTFKSGDKCVYFPVDSVLPDWLEAEIFGGNAKVKLSNSRVRTIRLRGAISQGLAVPLKTVGVKGNVGDDLTSLLGVKKYEPPQKGNTMGGQRVSERNQNPYFEKYTDIQHLKKYPEVLKGKLVVATEKIHGTNFRAGWVPSHPKNWWDRLKKRFGYFPEWEFVYGSHNVQLQGKYKSTDFYSKKTSMDVYSKIVRDLELKTRLKKGEVIYGEIYGWQVQKNYWYGCKQDEHHLAVVDLKVNGKFVSYRDLLTWCMFKDFEYPPILYIGEFDMYIMEAKVGGPSLVGSQPVREGLVVRTQDEEVGHCGRMVFKFINPEYLLLKDNSEYH